MITSSNCNERLIALTNQAIRTFLGSLPDQRKPPELQDALKPDEAFVTLHSPTVTLRIINLRPAGMVDIEVGLAENGISASGQICYEDSGRCRTLRQQDAVEVLSSDSLMRMRDQAVINEIYCRLQRLLGDARLKNSRRNLDVSTHPQATAA